MVGFPHALSTFSCGRREEVGVRESSPEQRCSPPPRTPSLRCCDPGDRDVASTRLRASQTRIRLRRARRLETISDCDMPRPTSPRLMTMTMMMATKTGPTKTSLDPCPEQRVTFTAPKDGGTPVVPYHCSRLAILVGILPVPCVIVSAL